MSTWWEESFWEVFGDEASSDFIRSSTAALFFEYVRARWQPFWYRSRAMAPPILRNLLGYRAVLEK
jgi:hypothetical protein